MSRNRLKKLGIAHWMERVLEEVENARSELGADAVHDLRVAIRRCRAIGEAFRELDPEPEWQTMRKAGKAVFAPLGELRDVQVMLEWVEKLRNGDNATADSLRTMFEKQEHTLKVQALGALKVFDKNGWESSISILEERAQTIPAQSIVFKCLALERWQEARKMHDEALRVQTPAAFHQLRIGIKHFRYIVENFLPDLLEKWGDDLKELQDLLGEVHDLDVLWQTALNSGSLGDAPQRRRWSAVIVAERSKRFSRYHKMMVGRESLWDLWRESLPQGPELYEALLEELRKWASFRDADPRRTTRVERVSLQIYDGIPEEIRAGSRNDREILEAALTVCDAGRRDKSKRFYKAVSKMLAASPAPDAWAEADRHMTALISQYGCGPVPRPDDDAVQKLSVDQQNLVALLGSVLRLAYTICDEYDGVRDVRVSRSGAKLVISATAKNLDGREGRKIATARKLLEAATGMEIAIEPWSERGRRDR